MPFLTRRDFLQDSAALAASLTGLAYLPRAAATETAPKKGRRGDANDTLHVAVIGVNGRGQEHVKGFAGRHNCIVTTICDADADVIGPAMHWAEKAQGKTPRFEQDLRRVMDDKSIDIVTTATPNHWHALVAIWALQSGKDVYVEKPVSHNVSEGRKIVEAARRYQRICQTGTQSRSQAGMREAMDFLHSGKLGKIRVARGLCYKWRPSIGKVSGPQPIPASVNYDLWCGPAPDKPLMRKHLHYDWHWVWDYGNGDLGNQGIHEMDKARWGLAKNEPPRSVISLGGRFGYLDDGQTANTQICVYDYGDVELIFEVRGLKTEKFHGVGVGNIFQCDEGILVLPSYSGGVALALDGSELRRFGGGGDHFGNFVQAVRSRKAADLSADILEGHLSSALCHLGNVSYRVGSEQPFSKQTRAFGDDREAYETLLRMREHLNDNKVPLDNTLYRIGRRLTIDPVGESFVNDAEANRLLTRDYRKPYVVPDKV
jgi:predicted dehydrogenase